MEEKDQRGSKKKKQTGRVDGHSDDSVRGVVAGVGVKPGDLAGAALDEVRHPRQHRSLHQLQVILPQDPRLSQEVLLGCWVGRHRGGGQGDRLGGGWSGRRGRGGGGDQWRKPDQNV